MNNPTFFSFIDLDVFNVNKAFEDVYSWLTELNMANEAEVLADDVAEEFKTNNPFNTYRHFDDEMIRIIYKVASDKIRAKFPNAIITTNVSGYNSTFRVDDETYNAGYAERWAEE